MFLQATCAREHNLLFLKKMYSKTSQRLNKFCCQNCLNLFLQLLYNILYFLFRKLTVYYKFYIFMKKNIFEKKSEFKCDRILNSINSMLGTQVFSGIWEVGM